MIECLHDWLMGRLKSGVVELGKCRRVEVLNYVIVNLAPFQQFNILTIEFTTDHSLHVTYYPLFVTAFIILFTVQNFIPSTKQD